MEQIISCPDSVAHAVLIALCHNPEIAETASRHIAALTRTGAGGDTGDRPGAKRKADELEICGKCDEPFTESANSPSACGWHDGELEPDYESDVWADHDENVHGTIDSDFCRKEYPEGFIWSCCGRDGADVEACTFGRHLGVAGVMKRLRSNGTTEDSEDDDEDDDDGTSENSEGESEGDNDDSE